MKKKAQLTRKPMSSDRRAGEFSSETHACNENATGRPIITTYDSEYEHSLEHLVYTRHLVDHAFEEITIREELERLLH